MISRVAWLHCITVLVSSMVCPSVKAAIPDMVCHLRLETQLDPQTLQGKQAEPREVYRIKDGEPFISRPERGEYRYGKLIEVEPNRFVSGHKTLIFVPITTQPKAGRMLMFHADAIDIRVAEFSCPA